jgi:hypothetical protein
MPKKAAPLTDIEVRKAKPSDKPVRLFDGGGLYLEISPAGGKLWRMKYRYGGKERLLAIGKYPEISLAEARARRDESRKQLANGDDPSEVKKTERAARAEQLANSFEAVAREWFAKHSPNWAESHAGKIIKRLENDQTQKARVRSGLFHCGPLPTSAGGGRIRSSRPRRR